MLEAAYDNHPDVAGADANRKYTWLGDIAESEDIGFDFSDGINLATTFAKASMSGNTAVVAGVGISGAKLASIARNADGRITNFAPQSVGAVLNTAHQATAIAIHNNIVASYANVSRSGLTAWYAITAREGSTASFEAINIPAEFNISGRNRLTRAVAINDKYCALSSDGRTIGFHKYSYNAATKTIIHGGVLAFNYLVAAGIADLEFNGDILYIGKNDGTVEGWRITDTNRVLVFATRVPSSSYLAISGEDIVAGGNSGQLSHNIFTPSLVDAPPTGYSLVGRAIIAPFEIAGQQIRGYRVRAYREIDGGSDLLLSTSYIWHDIFGRYLRTVAEHRYVYDTYIIRVDNTHLADINYGLRFDAANQVLFMNSRLGRIASDVYFEVDVMTGTGGFPSLEEVILQNLAELPLSTTLADADAMVITKADGSSARVLVSIMRQLLVSLSGGITAVQAGNLINAAITAQIKAPARTGQSTLWQSSELVNAPGIRHDTVSAFTSAVGKVFDFIYGEGSTSTKRIGYIRSQSENIIELRTAAVGERTGFSTLSVGDYAEGGSIIPNHPPELLVLASNGNDFTIILDESYATPVIIQENITLRFRLKGATSYRSVNLTRATVAIDGTDYYVYSGTGTAGLEKHRIYEMQINQGGNATTLHAGDFMSTITDLVDRQELVAEILKESETVGGEGGASILEGTTAPTADQGNDGDLYIHKDNDAHTADLYLKAAGVWGFIASFPQDGNLQTVLRDIRGQLADLEAEAATIPGTQSFNEMIAEPSKDVRVYDATNLAEATATRDTIDGDYYMVLREISNLALRRNVDIDSVRIYAVGSDLSTTELHREDWTVLQDRRIINFNISDAEKSGAAGKIQRAGGRNFYHIRVAFYVGNSEADSKTATLWIVGADRLKTLTDSAAQIKAKLESLGGDDRLPASAIKDLPSGSRPETTATILSKGIVNAYNGVYGKLTAGQESPSFGGYTYTGYSGATATLT